LYVLYRMVMLSMT